MLTKEVRDWLNKVKCGAYSYNDAMAEFIELSRYLTKDEMKMLKSKINEYRF